MQKQKTATINDRGIKPPKIRKIETPILSQNEGLSQIQTHYQSTPQNINSIRTIDDPVAVNDDLDRLLGIWNHARENQCLSINDDREQLKELREQVSQADSKIEKLENALRQVEEENVTMTKYIESEVTMQNEIIEKQNIALYLMSTVEEHTDVITDTLRHCEESRKDLTELYDKASSKQDENMEKLTEQSDNQISTEQTDLMEQLELKNSELLSAETRCEQYKYDVAKITQQISEVNVAVEKNEKTINENRIKYEEEIKKMSDEVKNVEEHLTTEQQENFKLAAENDQSSKQVGDLFSQHKALQVTAAQFEEQIEFFQFNLQKLKEEETNLVTEIAQLNSEHTAVISNKDLELNDYRKQLEELELAQKETAAKLIEAASNNKELSQTVAERVENIEQLKKALKNKDDEMVKLNGELTSAFEKQQQLCTIIQNVKEQLITRENEIKQIKEDSGSWSTRDDERVKRICEARTRLTEMKKILEDKCHEEIELIKKIENDRIEFAEQAKYREEEIVQKDRQLRELTKVKEDLRKKTERKKSEHNKKMQGLKRLLKQCELAEHEKQIDEQNAKIETLTRELEAEEHKLEGINVQKVERDKQKAEKKLEFVNLETQLANLGTKYSAIKKTNEDLNKKWKEVRTSKEIESARKLMSTNSSPLLARSYSRNKSIPVASTPKQSTPQVQGSKFDSGSFSSDISSINGLPLYEDPEDRFSMLVRSNKTDAAKLSEPDREAREKLLTSPILNNARFSQVQAGNKFFKRYGAKK